MSYCQIENTARALRQVLNTLKEHDTVLDFLMQTNEYEFDYFGDLRDLAEALVNLIDEDGTYEDVEHLSWRQFQLMLEEEEEGIERMFGA